MRNRITIYEPEANKEQAIRKLSKEGSGSSFNSNEFNYVPEIMAAEGREDFYNYIRGLGLGKDRNMVFLSSVHHYYYDADEMKRVNTVINLKELNQVKEIKGFLRSIQRILPQKTNFIGCFVDNTKVNGFELRRNGSSGSGRNNSEDLENGVVSLNPFLNMLYNFMDMKTYKFMSGKSVSAMLTEHGFRIIDMKEINGLTYFHAQKVSAAEV